MEGGKYYPAICEVACEEGVSSRLDPLYQESFLLKATLFADGPPN